jgi:cyclase
MQVEPRVIPVLLIADGRFVKTRRFSDPVYVGDPVNVLSIFNEFVVDEIITLDIVAAKSRVPQSFDLLQHYAEECFIPLAYGGGLTSMEQIGEVFRSGYEKVVVNSLLADRPGIVESATSLYGSQAVVASIDVRGGRDARKVVIHGNGDVVADSPAGWARRAVDLGVGEILVTSVDREGTGIGFDLELVAEVAEAVDVPVIAHGGAGQRTELALPVLESGASAVAAGSLFVFQSQERGVLINYPPRSQIERLFRPTDRAHVEPRE